MASLRPGRKWPWRDAQYFFVHASYVNAANLVLDKASDLTMGVAQLRHESIGRIYIPLG